MRHSLLLAAAFAASASLASAGEWQKPVYSGSYQPLTVGDTVYIYNTEAQLFLTEGNDWGTHATVGLTGLRFIVNPYIAEGAEWDGTNYIIQSESIVKESWNQVFITDGGNVYVDLGKQADYYFTFNALEGNTYQILGSDLNPVWKSSGDLANYMVGRFTGYVDAKNGVETGTGVIFDLGGADSNYNPGEFQTTWAFVSQDDYVAYQLQAATYEAAQSLAAAIDKAESVGVSDLDDEKAVYANTSSTLEELKAAIETVEKKILANAEATVTPDDPMDIFFDSCDNIDNWTNGILADTWNTQTYIDPSWEGFEGTTLNIWGSALEGSAHVEKSSLPNGIYVVKMAVFSEKLEGYVFANENAVTVSAGATGKTYTVTTNVTDGELQFGFSQDISGTNWVAIDNVDVKYYGNGAQAYKFWLSSLQNSSSGVDYAIYDSSLKKEYDAVLAKVDNANTDEEILAVIKEYEEVLGKIAVSAEAYNALSEACDSAETIINDPLCNTYYGEKLGDMVQEKEIIIEEHTSNNETVNAATKEMNELLAEAQNFIWKVEKFNNELVNAASIYAEYSESCTAAAREAYNAFMAANNPLNADDLTAADVESLISRLYDIEFNLTVKDVPATDDEPADYTAKIFNPTIIGTEGWTNDGWSTMGNNDWYGFTNEEGASSGDGNYLNLWNVGPARAYQTLTNLPAGAYTLTCGAFANAEGLEVYANESAVAIPAGQDETLGYMRLYSVDVIVGEDGILEIGVRSTSEGEVWGMADEFRLAYKGTDSEICVGINGVQTAKSSDNAATLLSGVKAGRAANGIIVKNNKKYYVK